MATKIPDTWKATISEILKEGFTERLEVTIRAFQNFQDLFPDAFNYHMLEAFIAALGIPDLTGKRVYGITPEGEAYEFIFTYRSRPVYGKVCLRKDGRLVVIISAHRPLKGNEV